MIQSEPSRVELFQRIRANFRPTPLFELRELPGVIGAPIPNDNRIFIKFEHLNPTGSHYDRIYLDLLEHLELIGDEENRRIDRNRHLLQETTTGNAGVSFAWLCRVLGYESRVYIPGDMAPLQISQMQSFGADVRRTPRGQYIDGLLRAFRRGLVADRRDAHSDREPYAPNHSRNRLSLVSMAKLGNEITLQLDDPNLKVARLDYFIGALGNGVSAKGVHDGLRRRWPSVELIGVEPFECPTVLAATFPERFRERYAKDPTFGRHRLIGTGSNFTPDRVFDIFPFMRELELTDVRLVRDAEWESMARSLSDTSLLHLGRTSAAVMHAAIELTRDVRGKNIVTIAYDASWKYLGAS